MGSDKLNKLKSLLIELDKKNISYVSWKDNNDLKTVFKGEGDIDIYIPIEIKKDLLSYKSLGWIELINL